jgi:pantoate--beta-alanine ligase
MQIFRTIQEAKKYLRLVQSEGLRVGLVPTMGALHDGHLSLVGLAKTRSEVVVSSIFVNPTQFAPNEDFTRYPRDLEGDSKKLASAGCDAIFAPETAEIYPDRFQTYTEVLDTSRGLCGDRRPGHFRGVTTVVLKLFNIIRPDVAVFGEKDFQQLAVLRAMALDLALDVEVIGAPLIRDPDGLAMSSRNAFLSPADRAQALFLSRALFAARDAYVTGQKDRLVDVAGAVLREGGVEPEYLELREYTTLSPLVVADRPAVILVAARVGSTRLIDNVILSRP